MQSNEQLHDLSVQYENQLYFFKVRDELGKVSETVSDRIVIREAFGENTYSLKREDFTHSGVFVDLGANIGAVSIFAKALGAREVYAFEPEPENREILLKNIEINRLNINVVPKAIWHTAGKLDLVASQGATTSNPEAIKAHPKHVVSVECVTLEDALMALPEVDVLKCDTEGAEYEILLDPEVNKKCRKIVIEYHTTTTEKFGTLLAILTLTHNVQAYGDYKTGGGQIIAYRY